MTFKFEITHRDPNSRTRLGRLTTPHGTIDTPNFIFCGTKASIKGLSPAAMRDAKTDIILANTYHLMLSPGADIVAAMGGLHKFMGWDGPMLTDSGGFQLFSLMYGGVTDEIKGKNQSKRPKTVLEVNEEGAKFKSYLDGSVHFLTPESSIDIQRKLGADFIVQLDECPPYHVPREHTARSMELSMRWGDRSLAEWKRKDDGRQKMYGVTQGGVFEEFRKTSCDWLRNQDFFGTAVGGCLGNSREQMYEIVAMQAPWLHPDRPVHLLGIGTFVDILTHVKSGMDTFDCVQPTRIARHGWALVKGAPKERINIRNKQYQTDQDPVDSSCGCYACKNHSRGYIHHLFRAGELLGMQLVSIHNVFTMNRLMRELRAAIAAGTLDALHKEWVA
jgi:queuine tRNA-ribosyltransferase